MQRKHQCIRLAFGKFWIDFLKLKMKRVCLIVALSIVLSVQLVYSCSPPPKPGQGLCGSDGQTYRSVCYNVQSSKGRVWGKSKIKDVANAFVSNDLRIGLPYIFKPLCTQMQTGSQSVCVLTLQWRVQTGLQAKSRTEPSVRIKWTDLW